MIPPEPEPEPEPEPGAGAGSRSRSRWWNGIGAVAVTGAIGAPS